ncbi:CRISPR-associated Cse2 family protein [Grimontella sp. AG753]|nr:CRISPR-associated Cse2 family protein [Grimontella sp. AG753]
MLNSDTKSFRKITHPQAQQAIKDWFATLTERYASEGAKRINGRAWRAELKRMELPYGSMMSESFHVLRQRISVHMPLEPINEMALALFACVAAHIKTHQGKLSFAAQLGEKLNGDKPCFSVLRFERLQKASDPETFCQLLIQAVKIRGDEGVNLLSLADSIFLWMDEWHQLETHQPLVSDPFARNRIRWASEYLSTSHAK